MKLLFRCVDIHKSAGWACFFMRSQPTADAGVHCPHTEVKLYITNPDNLDAFILGRDYPLTLEQESHETAAAADVLTDPFPQESIRVSPGSFTVENNVIDGPQGAPSQDALTEEAGAEGVPVLNPGVLILPGDTPPADVEAFREIAGFPKTRRLKK